MESGARYHQTRQGGSLHTDNVASTRPWDLLFMSCVAPALVGGESIICSSVTLYNFLKQSAPAALGMYLSRTHLYIKSMACL
jgi:hypothetical protein